MNTFKAGQKVVCISEFVNNPIPAEQATLPIKGKIYTIRKVRKGVDGEIGILLVEIVNKSTNTKGGFQEQGFVSEGFRPLKYNDVSAEILTQFKITEEKSDVEIKEAKPKKEEYEKV